MTAPTTGRVEPLGARPVFEDDFRSGFDDDGRDARWQVRPVGALPRGDGVVTTSDDGLVVFPSATNPTTGRPCFAAAPDGGGHLRWAALANRTSTAGFPGFDAGPDGWLVIEAELSARAFGLDDHPCDDVTDPDRDARLGTAALVTVDRETGMVFDFFLANRQVYAVYERLPQPGGVASFSYAVAACDREPETVHHCAIAYSRADGRVRWVVDGREVLAVDRIGLRDTGLGPSTRDNGEPDRPAEPRQLTVGMALMADRAWGQGVLLAMRHVAVWRRPSDRSNLNRAGGS